jgi:hypothetical protein
MSNGRYTEVTQQSWFSRIGGAVKGVVVGFILFLLAFPLLFWNEGRAVKRQKTLEEGAGAVVSIAADSVDGNLEGKLVHLTGRAETDAVLTDPEFGVSSNAIKLTRNVEMYQWRENKESKTTKKVGGGTETVDTYSYTQSWSEHLIDSSHFKQPEGHQNPGVMPYESRHMSAEEVTLGAFRLSSSLVGKINEYKPMPIEDWNAVPHSIRSRAKSHNQGIYIGFDPSNPQIGDLRVSFQVVRPTEVSIVAKQEGSLLGTYVANTGGTIELLQVGVHNADQMFKAAETSNKILTWVLRLVGFFMMMIGLGMILKPLSVLADVLPILGDIVGAGTGLIALLIAAVLSSLTIAIAWIVYRPLLGIALLAVAVAIAVGVTILLKRARHKAPAPSRPAGQPPPVPVQE